MSVADAIDVKVIDSDAPREEKRVVALGWKARAAAAMQRGLTMVKAGTNLVVEGARYVARHFGHILYALLVLVGIAAFICLNVLFWVWIFSVSPILFWVLFIIYVMNLAGGLIAGLAS